MLRRFGALLVSGALTVLVFGSAAAAAPNLKAFCAANLKINLALNTLGAAAQGGPPPAQAVEQAKSTIVPLVQQAINTAPSSVKGAAQTAGQPLINDFEGTVQNPPPGQAAAADAINRFALTNCGYRVVKVNAQEYSFRGIPSSLKPGTVLFNMKDAGSEAHELVMVRIKTKATVQQLLALPQNQVLAQIDVILPGGPVNPGGTVYGYAQLTPGRYAALCFVSQGTTDIKSPANGQPHALKGMVFSFTVTK